jgi:hypothetical protein
MCNYRVTERIKDFSSSVSIGVHPWLKPQFLKPVVQFLEMEVGQPPSFFQFAVLEMLCHGGVGSGFLRHHFAPAPNINRRAVGTGGFTRGQACAPEGAAYGGCKRLGLVLAVLRFHGFVSSS